MSEPFLGQISILPYRRTPVGWHLCDGSLLAISDYDALYTLIGTTYGGDGKTTFGIPDMRGRLPLHQGTGPGLTERVLGQSGGAEEITLTLTQMPAHSHPLLASTSDATLTSPSGALPAKLGSGGMYHDPDGLTQATLAPQAVGIAGGGQPHENCMPTIAIGYYIALQGIFPSRT